MAGRSRREDAVKGDFVKFLGTAGARFVMARQLRYSAGTLVALDGRRIMLDPGPGTLVRCARARPRIDPTGLDAVILTHTHIDHSGDLNALLDAMTGGGHYPRGTLFAPRQCIEGPDAVLLGYLRPHLKRIVLLEPEADYAVGPVRFSTSVRHRHSAETYGLKFRHASGMLAFLVDTAPFDGLADAYADADVLVISVVLHDPPTSPHIMHLSLEDARELIRAVRPKKAVLTHFGMTMLKARPRDIAAGLGDELGTEVVAASDGMTLPL
jgi:phosphoribosyl 1,2-cyclic phosphodiesterase